jgi:hypothetical protein
VASTLREAEAAWLLLVESGDATVTAPGLYGGLLATASRDLSLLTYSISPGVKLTGHLTIAAVTYPLVFSGKLIVTGPHGTSGTLTASGGHLRGTLGGRRVSR